MAENRAAFILRRRRSLGFSKCRWLRTSFRTPSRSIFFFNRRSAFSTDSPFVSLISVNADSLPLRDLGAHGQSSPVSAFKSGGKRVVLAGNRVNLQKQPGPGAGRKIVKPACFQWLTGTW